MTSYRHRSLATPQGSPLRGAQGSMFPGLQDLLSMEEMGHKVFGASRLGRGWVLVIRPWVLGGFLPQCLQDCAVSWYTAGSVSCCLLGVSMAMPNRRAVVKLPRTHPGAAGEKMQETQVSALTHPWVPPLCPSKFGPTLLQDRGLEMLLVWAVGKPCTILCEDYRVTASLLPQGPSKSLASLSSGHLCCL